MSWLLRGRPERRMEEAGEEVVSGVEFVVKRVGDDLVVQGRARGPSDVERLRRIADEVFKEIYERNEAEPAGPASPRRFAKQH
ncbi:MAG: hypothetical protein QXU87_03940 [Candidatus Caldarchaeum sp.]